MKKKKSTSGDPRKKAAAQSFDKEDLMRVMRVLAPVMKIEFVFRALSVDQNAGEGQFQWNPIAVEAMELDPRDDTKTQEMMSLFYSNISGCEELFNGMVDLLGVIYETGVCRGDAPLQLCVNHAAFHLDRHGLSGPKIDRLLDILYSQRNAIMTQVIEHYGMQSPIVDAMYLIREE